MASPPHRLAALSLLQGNGLEIGALHEPTILPPGCTMRYFDRLTADEAGRVFPELNRDQIVNVDFVGDLDRGGARAVCRWAV